VDEGKLDWDKPVKAYMPTFKLYDPFATERMTPRDLVTHRSGLPRHDLMWYNSSFMRQELFDRLQYLEPTKDFRTVFQYQNLMFMTAGFMVGQLSGASWEQFVQERIFNALEMGSSNFSVLRSQESANFALPYKEQDDEVVEIPFRNIDTIGPAGSINSNLVDMVNWVLLHLGKGEFKGRRVISEGNLVQMHTPQMVMPDDPLFLNFEELGHQSYGLGWFIQQYRGHKLVHHAGGIDGFVSLISFMPQQDIGIVALSNLNGNAMAHLVSFNIYDRLLGLEQLPWSARIKEQFDGLKEAGEKAREKSAVERRAGTQPSHPLEEYAGDYEHPGYGVFSVALKDGQLEATYNAMHFPLEHYHYDVFDMNFEAFNQQMKVSFFSDTKGSIGSLSVPLEPAVDAIVFTRMPEKGMKEKAFLEQFAGEYELFGIRISVFLKGEDALALSIPGQPELELVPYRGTEFTVKGAPGFSVAFKQDASGAVTEAVVTQPQGVFTAQKAGE
jgi:CubicO group peptidase (beta-lactamase class C family)